MPMFNEHPDQLAGASQLDAERFRLHYKHDPIPIYIWQRIGEDFILRNYNDAAAVLTKNHIHKLVGSKASELFKDQPDIPDDFLRCFSSQVPFSREMPYRMITTGENKYLRVRYIFVPEDMVVVHTEDITEKHQIEEDLRAIRAELEDRVRLRTQELIGANRKLEKEIAEHKLTEKALADRETRFRTLAENIPGAVYRCACDKEWTVEFLNENIYDLAGYPPSDFIGNKVRSYASIIHVDDVAMVEKIVFEQVKKREPFVLEYRIMHRDGAIRWVYEKGRGVYDQNGNVLYLDGVIFDVTERKQVELQAKRWLGLLDATRDGIFIFDPESLYFSYVNQGAIDQTGYSRAELLTMTPLDIKPEFTKQRFRQMIAPMVADELPVRFFATVHRRKDGSDVPVEVILQIIAPEGGSRHFVALVRDITERKLVEEALKESEQKLKKQKLALEQKNLALQEILGQIEIEKKQIKEGVVANVEELLLPSLRKLRRKGSALDNKHIDLLEKSALQLTSGFGMRVSERRWRLTPREIEICNMIKSGLSSKEIAELISVSSRTIEIHRNNIRKKMGLSRKKVNLTTHLQSF